MQVNTTSMTSIFNNTSSSSSEESSLSLDQQILIEETLANYDASSLSESDAQEIVKAFSEAGIEPSRELESTLSSIGFDAKEIGDLAGMGQAGGGKPAGGPPPPPPSDEELSSITDLLESLLSDDEDDETTTSSATASSSPYAEDEIFSSFNSILDYTNQIVNLKEEAKEDVMNILDDYKTSESQQDTQKSIINSLNEILNKPQNYNRISFYA